MLEALYLLLAMAWGYFLGFCMRDIRDLARRAYMAATQAVKPKGNPALEEAFKSRLVEPLTPEQQAKKDFEDRFKKLNGGSL